MIELLFGSVPLCVCKSHMIFALALVWLLCSTNYETIDYKKERWYIQWCYIGNRNNYHLRFCHQINYNCLAGVMYRCESRLHIHNVT